MEGLQFTPYAVPLAAIAVGSLMLAAQIHKRRNASSAKAAEVMLLAAAIYAGGYAVELSNTTMAGIGLWTTIEYLGIVAIPPAVLAFALSYSGHGYLVTRRALLLLALEPTAIFLLRATNRYHHLIHAEVLLDSSGPFVAQRIVSYGPAFWVHVAYAYVMSCIALFVLAQMLLRSYRSYRLQASVLLAGLLAPWIANAATVLWHPVPLLDLTPFGFAITGLAMVWSLFGLEWLDIVPVARTAVTMGIADAVLVLDSHDRAVFLNPAAEQLLGLRDADAHGHALEDVCQAWPALVERLHQGAEAGKPIELTRAAQLRRYEVRVSEQRDWRERLTSRVVMLRDITASSAADELERRNREYLRSLVENALDIIAVLSADGVLAYASPSAQHILGYKADEHLGASILDLIHPDEADTVAHLLAHAGRNPELVQRLELRFLHANGEWRTLEAIGRALCEQGRSVGVVVNARDVTEQRAAEDALRQRADELAALQQTLLDISAPHDLQSLLARIVERSAQLLQAPTAGLYLVEPEGDALRLAVSHNTAPSYDGVVLKYGEGVAGVVAQTARPLIVEDYRIWEHRAAVYEREQPFTSVLSVPMLWQGRVIGTISVSNRPSDQPFTPQDQELLALFASHAAIAIANARLYDAAQSELAERRRAEAALIESEERYRSLVENMPVGVMRTTPGPEGRYLMANQAFLSMFGFDSFEQLSLVSPASLYVHREDRAEISRRVLAEGKVCDVELEFKRRDGTRLWGMQTLRAARDAGGQVTHFDCLFQDVTERRLASEELQRLKEFNEGIVQGMAEALMIEDEQGVFTFLNPAVERLLGYRPGELLGRPWQSIVAPDQVAWIEEKVAQRPRGVSEQYETRMLRKDGTEVPVLVHARPLLRDGRFVGVLTACADITELKRAGEALRESEERYRALFAKAERRAADLKLLSEVRAALAGELDEQSIYRKVVEVIARTFGYTQVSLYLLQGDTLRMQHQVGYDHVIESIPVSQGITGRVVRNNRAMFLRDVHRDPAFLGAIEGVTSEVCVPLHEGERAIGVLNIESRFGVQLTRADLRLMRAVAEHVDIALARARLYAQALKDEARYRRIFEDSPISLWEQDFSEVRRWLQGLRDAGVSDFRAYFDAHPEEVAKWPDRVKVIDVNQATVTLFHAGGKPALLAGVGRLMPADGHAGSKEHLMRLAEGQLYWRGEIAGRTLSGEELYVDITWQVFPGYEQTWERAITSAIDITERKRAEQQRQALEAQLRQAQKMEGMGLLAGSVAHDFNNLLTVILANTELALEQLDAECAVRAELTRALGAAQRGAGLARQLLAFSRRRAPQVQHLDVNEVVGEFVRLMGPLLGEKVSVQLDLCAGLPLAPVDAGGLEQVLMNLALNARDAMPQGGVLRVSTTLEEVDGGRASRHSGARPGPYVCLKVADNGVGMDEGVRRRLFEPFFTTKAPGKGTGLGLTVVQSIARQHRGFVQVDSQPGQGSEFRVYLPVDAGASQEPLPVHDQSAMASAEQS